MRFRSIWLAWLKIPAHILRKHNSTNTYHQVVSQYKKTVKNLILNRRGEIHAPKRSMQFSTVRKMTSPYYLLINICILYNSLIYNGSGILAKSNNTYNIYFLEANVAEKFLSHLRDEKRCAKSASLRNRPQTYTPRAEHCKDDAASGIKGERPRWRPHTSINYGSYYSNAGCGNSHSLFRQVRNAQQPPSPSPGKPVRECTAPVSRTRTAVNYFPPPTNYSSMCEVVPLQSNIEGSACAPHAICGRSGRSTTSGSICSPTSQSSSSRTSSKLKFSANMQQQEEKESILRKENNEDKEHCPEGDKIVARDDHTENKYCYPQCHGRPSKYERVKSAGCYPTHRNSDFHIELRRRGPRRLYHNTQLLLG